MKEWIKANWKNITIKAVVILILNTPLWVFLIGSFVPHSTIGEFRLSWIDYLRLSDKVEWYHIWFLYIAIATGISLTIFFIKWWVIASGQKKQTNSIIDAIKNEKKKEDKYDKFIGE